MTIGSERTEGNLRVTMVTSSAARHHSFEMLLPNIPVRRLDPRFTEELIPAPLNSQPSEWPMEMAERKAFQDITARFMLAALDTEVHENLIKEIGGPDVDHHLFIYSDTITVSYAGETSDETPKVLNKPKDLASWFQDKEEGALALSGKNIEICTALTAIDMKHPDAHPITILVKITAKMKPYTLSDVRQLIEIHGPQAVLTTAGGISIWNGGTSLYDGTVPLKVYLQSDPRDQPVLVNEIRNWQTLDTEQLKQILYGAVPQAMGALLTRLDTIEEQKKAIDQIPQTVKQAKSNLASKADTLMLHFHDTPKYKGT